MFECQHSDMNRLQVMKLTKLWIGMITHINRLIIARICAALKMFLCKLLSLCILTVHHAMEA
jgi:hypothetical protein